MFGYNLAMTAGADPTGPPPFPLSKVMFEALGVFPGKTISHSPPGMHYFKKPLQQFVYYLFMRRE